MSKFAKLSDEIMRKKLNSSISNDFPDELNIKINEILSNFDRKIAEELCIEIETTTKIIKEKKRHEQEENISYKEEKNFEIIIDKNDFTSLKNSFGIIQEDENGEPLFSSLDEQFKNELSKYSLRLYRAEYYEKIDYNPDKEFIHKNLNIGLVNQFDDLKDYVFACFRFFVDPLENKCVYVSWWIINAKEPLSEILGIYYDNFIFTEISLSNRETFVNAFKKSDSIAILNEKYLR